MPATATVSFGELTMAQQYGQDVATMLRERVQAARRESADVLLVFTCYGFTSIHADLILGAHAVFTALMAEELPEVTP